MIRAALIDIGNVLQPFSHDIMCAQMAVLAGVDTARLKDDFLQSGIFDDFERGLVTGEGVHRWFCDTYAVSPSVDDLRVACSDMFTRDPLWPPLLDALRAQGIRMVALTNTCSWHIRWIEDTDVVLQRLDAVATSWQVGQRKPHPDIYNEAVRLAQCSPAECVYLDDIEHYVDTATSLGINAHLYVDVPSTVEIFRVHGCDPFAPVAGVPRVIRLARPRDALGAAAAWHRAMQVGYRDIFPPNGPDVSIARLLTYWQHIAKDPLVHQFVAETAGVVIGTVVLQVAPDGASARFQRLMVHPDAWGTHTGLALHDAAVEHARSLGVATLTLDVLAENTRARTMYERHGWTEVHGSLRPIPDATGGQPLMSDFQLTL